MEDCPSIYNSLEIRRCDRKEWHLQRLPSLIELYIIHNGSDEEIVVVRIGSCLALFRLTISNLKTFTSQVLKSLTSLEYLDIRNLPQIQSLLEQGLPSSLSELSICHFPILQSLPESAFPSSLSKLTINDCPNLQSLPLKAMPSTKSAPTLESSADGASPATAASDQSGDLPLDVNSNVEKKDRMRLNFLAWSDLSNRKAPGVLFQHKYFLAYLLIIVQDACVYMYI
ncbi:hypothetical protein CQW23_27932 [Capsicum baccatum]|uniref:ABC transporter family G domain-containing protein n=1 Tax=Capsicum baccatum TaxID=33114 RepID=A0A2G2VF22_CAPBA|nr:hypothetical protein CQW23_27932 [Capsicum baccatum]